ncbi:DUF4328 domain-containing protein [Streptosporangium carneum]|uniref:DUF4328 domain-containing protein n=1 Tax=Streptosporangium carneum TaxID=47481 RepID=UPI0022F32E5E|nr:DUF4328 domain-containing protein [Streptosporangium carneum]
MTLSAQVVAIAALVVFEHARGKRLAREISALGGDPHAPGAQAVVGAVTLFAILIMLVVVTVVASAAAYLTWLVQARQSAAVPEPSASPVLAAWLLPGVNLVVPPVLVYRLWWASRPPSDRHGRWIALLVAWWLSWLAAVTLVVARLPLGAAPGDSDLTGLGPVDLVAVALSALLCAATVRQITGIQAADGRDRRAGDRQGAGAAAPKSFPSTPQIRLSDGDTPRGSLPRTTSRQSQARISSQSSPAVSKRSS